MQQDESQSTLFHYTTLFRSGTEGRWRWQRSTVEEKYSTLEWLDRGNGLQPYVKTYLTEGRMVPPMTWWEGDDVGHNRTAKAEIKALHPNESPLFDTPKPERLLERIINIATEPEDIIVDVFAGSGTTAAVAQKMGRRWIACELVEETFQRFLRPRLEKVVCDADPGGITSTNEIVPTGVLNVPEKNTPEDFGNIVTLINRGLKQSDLPEGAIKTLKDAKKLFATKKSGTLTWRGGGSFIVAHLAPSCFNYDPELDLVTLTEDATGKTLVDSVAANLNFRLTPEHRYFH